MAISAKTDYLGLARTGLEILGNGANASNQLLEIAGANGALLKAEVFGSVKNPHCDYKITGSLTATNLAFKLGKVHTGTGNTGPYALKTVSIHTGAGDEPTFGADGVQIQSGATQAICTFTPGIPALSPARHALTFGAFTYSESSTCTLQSSDYVADCELEPTTINGVPRASDAVRAFVQVSVTFWTASDSASPAVTVASGWTQTADWDCTGSDGAMFVWTATFKKYLSADA